MRRGVGRLGQGAGPHRAVLVEGAEDAHILVFGQAQAEMGAAGLQTGLFQQQQESWVGNP